MFHWVITSAPLDVLCPFQGSLDLTGCDRATWAITSDDVGGVDLIGASKWLIGVQVLRIYCGGDRAVLGGHLVGRQKSDSVT